MDVKFPLDNYLNMVNATEPLQREQYKKEFIRNVNMRIKEIQNRAYINAAEDTLDFVLLFIPNEQVYGFIQEESPGILDEALKQKVVLCSPFTLYAMLSVVRQAYENFRYEKATKEIVNLIEQFAKTYELFKTRFEDLGKSIEKVQNQFSEIKDKSFKNLDIKIRRIDDYKKGNRKEISDQNQVIDVTEEAPDANPLVR
jgi:DNA recombination protein RmuC